MNDFPQIVLRNKRAYCPHCRIYVGKMQDDELNVGLVKLAERTHRLHCVKCENVFVYRRPEPRSAPFGNNGTPLEPESAIS